MVDPLRPGAKEFIAALHRAGLDTVMITGDQSATAAAIARELDLARGTPVRSIDSPAIADLDPDLLGALARQTHVFARVSADQKLGIVQALQRSERVVAMTGDGVNDAPALKAATIGIALGASGTALARDVANVVIRDDELTTLIDAIAQGRAVHRNIRRALQFLVTTNISEIAVSLVEALHGLNELETPMELLWINLVTDVLPGLGLALADPDPDVMDAPPRPPGEPIFMPEDFRRMALDGAMISASALTAHFVGLARHGPGPQTRGMTFLALALGQLLYTLTCQRSDVRRLSPGKLFENRALDIAILISGGLAVLPFLMPPLGRLLGVARLGPLDTAVGLTAAALPSATVLVRRGIELELHPLEERA
jgi:Ca2+-transporting ATPase